ncbi:hypothetical protein [Photobacterium leiognathi]|uniref:hypothetical protein n=1 Tax=Photobacterium leiognathi TaxID=553611 RepID=UPI002982AEEA|nr:hypothetical protein [Photobacterium leiognathi]
MEKICISLTKNPIKDPLFWNSMLGTFASIATIFAAIVGIIAICFAYKQLKTSHAQSSLGLYQQYLQLCVQYPKFAKGMNKPVDKNCQNYESYLWFCATMLFSFEQILLFSGKDPQWVNTIKHQLKNHKEMLRDSGSLKRKEWEPGLLNLISEILDESNDNI